MVGVWVYNETHTANRIKRISNQNQTLYFRNHRNNVLNVT